MAEGSLHSNTAGFRSAGLARGGLSNKAMWCVGLGLLANAAMMALTHFSQANVPEFKFDQAAFAQSSPSDRMLGARGLYMMPAQLGPSTYGVYLMDVDSQTITVYRAMPDTSRFRLMAARSFRNDRFLEDLNNETPTPKDVQKLVEAQRQRDAIEGKKPESEPSQ
jgi:hypothetical protein